MQVLTKFYVIEKYMMVIKFIDAIFSLNEFREIDLMKKMASINFNMTALNRKHNRLLYV